MQDDFKNQAAVLNDKTKMKKQQELQREFMKIQKISE